VSAVSLVLGRPEAWSLPIATAMERAQLQDLRGRAHRGSLRRLVVTVVGCLGLLGGVGVADGQARLDVRAARDAEPVVIWGDPLPGGAVCMDELRARPRTGAWRCLSSLTLDQSDPDFPQVARQPAGARQPCTHRRVENTSWLCLTSSRPSPLVLRPLQAQRNDPVFFADLRQEHRSSRPPDGSLCTEERRTLPRRGLWHCVTWERLPTNEYRLVQVVDPGAPCTFRSVDEFTGVWSCKSAKPISGRNG
jgi:hypothetical protein